MGLKTSIRAPVADRLRTVQSTLPPSLNVSTPCLKTLCRGAIRFSFIASFIAAARYIAIFVVQIIGSKLKSNKRQGSQQRRAINDQLTIMGPTNRHSIANALETIATSRLSA